MEKPNNPGMSEEAWKKLHKYVSKLNIKYAAEIQKNKEINQHEQVGDYHWSISS